MKRPNGADFTIAPLTFSGTIFREEQVQVRWRALNGYEDSGQKARHCAAEILNPANMHIQPTQQQKDAATKLADAVRLQNGELVETAVYQAFSSGLHPVHSQFLITLAEASWHCRHEDVVRALQQLHTPAAVDALERTAHAVPDYLAFDDGFALARKCTWALADIGTPEAQQALARLAACNNPIIAGYAQKRLSSWQRELHRKGESRTERR